MSNDDPTSVRPWVELLCGQKAELAPYIERRKDRLRFPPTGIGHSQLNELLLSFNLDRTSEGFFKYVFGGERVPDFKTFKDKITAYRIKAIIKYGNFKYSYKTLSNKCYDDICMQFLNVEPVPPHAFYKRHDPLMKLKVIPPKYTYYLGYMIQEQIKEKKASTKMGSTSRKKIEKEERLMKRTMDKGMYNNECYLGYDHLDVYVATSMREKIDFWNVSRFVKQVFENEALRQLNLRYFDPTQAYCKNRIDKGLVEGLMLKRAKCTIYMAGEDETLGKDSELATTLAQGKPVVAYVPELTDFERFKREYVNEMLSELYLQQNKLEVALTFLRKFYSAGAWENDTVKTWVNKQRTAIFDEVLVMVFENAQKAYDSRARTLKDYHPLGLQVNLSTGVANGVLVARNSDQCAKLVRGVLLNELHFDLVDLPGVPGATVLRERETKSIFRVCTKDTHLTNAFWNFYLKGNQDLAEMLVRRAVADIVVQYTPGVRDAKE